MKYNMSKIMRRAWELVKKMGMTISEGLKKAWKEAKGTAKKMVGSEKQIAWAQDIIKKAYEHVTAIEKHFENARDTQGEKYYNMNNDVVLACKKVMSWIDGRVNNVQKASEFIEHRNAMDNMHLNNMINRCIRSLTQQRKGMENIVLDLNFRA